MKPSAVPTRIPSRRPSAKPSVQPTVPSSHSCFVPGYYLDSSNCVPCTAGNYCTGNKFMTICSRGSYSDGPGATACKPCPKNTFQKFLGGSSCDVVVPGKKDRKIYALIFNHSDLSLLLYLGCFTLLESGNIDQYPCNAGAFCSGDGYNVSCSAGRYSPTIAPTTTCSLLTTLTPTASPTVQGFVNTKGCTACAKNSYMPSLGSKGPCTRVNEGA